MSTSPERDKEGFIESSSTLSNELGGNKKRSSSEIAEYPRRRATIAVCILYSPILVVRMYLPRSPDNAFVLVVLCQMLRPLGKI
jgi:hypothetical protein